MIKLPQNVIWIHTAFLGDLVLLTAASSLLRKAYPKVKQTLITTRVGSSLFGGYGEFDSVVTFDKGKGIGLGAIRDVVKTCKSLLGESEAIILQPHKSFRSTVLAKFLGYPQVTYFETNLSFLATIRVPRISTFHETARVGCLLEPLGISREDILKAKPFLESLESPESQELNDIFKKNKSAEKVSIAVAPGSRWGTKKWPIEYFKLLTKKLVSRGYLVYVLGSKDELDEGELLEDVDPEKVTNLCGMTKLSDLRYLIPKMNLVISNDSSPIHFASAFNIPTIGIFGATIPGFGFGPVAENSSVAEVEHLSCRPCSDHGPEKCPLGHFNCMRKLEVSVVYNLIEQKLKKRNL